jgi:hypothetical protein
VPEGLRPEHKRETSLLVTAADKAHNARDQVLIAHGIAPAAWAAGYLERPESHR